MWIAALLLSACVSSPPCEDIVRIIEARDPEQPTDARLQAASDALAALNVKDPEIAARVEKLSATLASSAASERELIEIGAQIAAVREKLEASRASAAPEQLAQVTGLLEEINTLQARLDAIGKEIAAHQVARVGQEAWLKRRCADE